MARHNITGQWGEQMACEYLIAQGYAIASRNWRSGHYELDIVAMKDNYVAFVEVKTRTNPNDDPLEAIDSRKIAHIVRSADVYIKCYRPHGSARFDVIAVKGSPDDFTIEHIRDAFFPPLKSYR